MVSSKYRLVVMVLCVGEDAEMNGYAGLSKGKQRWKTIMLLSSEIEVLLS